MTARIIVGHVLTELAKLPDESVHMVWTSVPYWGLRSYGTDPQIWGGDPACEHAWGALGRRRGPAAKQGINSHLRGRSVPEAQTEGAHADMGAFCAHCGAWRGEHGLEPTFSLWLSHEIEIFREVRRVLRNDGTLWLNVGDAYANNPSTSQIPRSHQGNGTGAFRIPGEKHHAARRQEPNRLTAMKRDGFKLKDRLMMPARLAIALQDDGWWLRDEIIWRKPNPMPSSVKDRTTPAHEMLYMLSKRARYFYDAFAIKEPCAVQDWENGTRVFGGINKHGANAQHGQRTTGRLAAAKVKVPGAWDTGEGAHGTINRAGRTEAQYAEREQPADRQKRSVWDITLEPFKGAHFATAPTKLVEPCILAGTSAKGVCPKCGAPWVRIVKDGEPLEEWKKACGADEHGEYHGQAIKDYEGTGAQNASDLKRRILESMVEQVHVGWKPGCKCDAGDPVPATVLDPFFGSGTTGLVAARLGRNCIGVELNPDYAKMARRRIRDNLGRVKSDMPEDRPADLPLFAGAA